MLWIILAVALPTALAYIGAPIWLIAFSFFPCALWVWSEARKSDPEVSIEQARVDLVGLELENFHLREPAVLSELDLTEKHQSIRLNFLALQEAMTLANLTARQLQDFMVELHSAAAQSEFLSLCGLFAAAEQGPSAKGSMQLSQESLRLAHQAQEMHEQADQVLTQLIESNNTLMSLIEAYLLLEQAPDADQVQGAKALAERIRKQCRLVQNQLRDLEPETGRYAKRWAGLHQILMITRNATGAVLRSSDQLLSGLSSKAG